MSGFPKSPFLFIAGTTVGSRLGVTLLLVRDIFFLVEWKMVGDTVLYGTGQGFYNWTLYL